MLVCWAGSEECAWCCETNMFPRRGLVSIKAQDFTSCGRTLMTKNDKKVDKTILQKLQKSSV